MNSDELCFLSDKNDDMEVNELGVSRLKALARLTSTSSSSPSFGSCSNLVRFRFDDDDDSFDTSRVGLAGLPVAVAVSEAFDDLVDDVADDDDEDVVDTMGPFDMVSNLEYCFFSLVDDDFDSDLERVIFLCSSFVRDSY